MNRNELCVLRPQDTTSTGIAIGEVERGLGGKASAITVIVSKEAPSAAAGWLFRGRAARS